jgi:hypothetical protein
MMGKKRLSDEERIKRRRERDRLRKRKQRASQKREQEMTEDFFGGILGGKTIEPHGSQTDKNVTNPDKIPRCPRCGHLREFCTCARDAEGKLTDGDGWLQSPV